MKNLVQLDMKRKKRAKHLLISVLFLAYTFLALALTLLTSRDQTELRTRELTYGTWHIALLNTNRTTIERMKTHGTVEAAGISSLYGMVQNDAQEAVGRLGSVDETTIRLQNIELMEGKMPETEDEIAVERSSLIELGYEPVCGQQITLHIQKVQDGGTIEEEQNFRLVGVLFDYSGKIKNATDEGMDYPSFLVTEQTDQTQKGNIVFRLKKENIAYFKEILLVKGAGGRCVENNYTYFELVEGSRGKQQQELKTRCFFLALALLVFQFFAVTVVCNYRKSQEKNIDVLEKLGMEPGEWDRLHFEEVIRVNTRAFFGGNALGILVAYGTLRLLGRFLETEYTFRISITAYGLLLLAEALVSTLILGMSIWIQSRWTVHRKRVEQRKRAKETGMIRDTYQKTAKKRRRQEWSKRFFFALGLFGLVYFAAYAICDLHVKYDKTLQYNLVDYQYGTLRRYYPARQYAPQELLETLEKVYGVESVEGVAGLTYLPMDWEDIEKSAYVELWTHHHCKQYTNTEEPQAFLMGIEAGKRLYQSYIAELDEGVVDMEAFERGEEVILYLPDCYYNPKTDSALYNQSASLQSGKIQLYQEKSLKVGEFLTIAGESVRIAGIIRTITYQQNLINVTVPFSVIGSYAFCNQLEVNPERFFGYLGVKFETDAEIGQTKEELERIRTHLTTADNQKKKVELVQVLWDRSLILMFIVLAFASLLLLCWTSAWRSGYVRRSLWWKTCWQLGISKQTIRWEALKKSVCTNFCGMIGGLLLLLLYHCGEYFSKHAIRDGYLRAFVKIVLADFFRGTMLRVLGVCTLVVWLLLMLASLEEIKKVIKNFKM